MQAVKLMSEFLQAIDSCTGSNILPKRWHTQRPPTSLTAVCLLGGGGSLEEVGGCLGRCWCWSQSNADVSAVKRDPTAPPLPAPPILYPPLSESQWDYPPAATYLFPRPPHAPTPLLHPLPCVSLFTLLPHLCLSSPHLPIPIWAPLPPSRLPPPPNPTPSSFPTCDRQHCCLLGVVAWLCLNALAAAPPPPPSHPPPLVSLAPPPLSPLPPLPPPS